MIRLFILITVLALSISLCAQDDTYITGTVLEHNTEGKVIPLVSANVFWLGTTQGTFTDKDGKFSIKKSTESSKLVVSYVGYVSDTVSINNNNNINVVLKTLTAMDEFTVLGKQKSTSIAFSKTLKVETLSEHELTKGACCNLSESFETSPSVDVSFTDAITGARQIEMLGLAGPYTQITRESIPDVRGLSSIYGMTYIPGTWVESIQLNKGAGSVVNGYESIAGQINVELRKPETADRLFLNGYVNQMIRSELNAHLAHNFKKKKWSTALLTHGSINPVKWDQNKDGFLDNPLGHSFIALNRWKYEAGNGVCLQFGGKVTSTENTGGQTGFNPTRHAFTTQQWGMQQHVNRNEGWIKLGKTSPKKTWQSVGLQVSGVVHKQHSYFGLKKYDASQNSLYANLIYDDIFNNTNHKFRSGLSMVYDDFNELYIDTTFARTEIVPGAFFEYNGTLLNNLSIVAGIRGDHHNIFGAFITPRLHVRYAITSQTVIRASGGRGQRTANILAENNSIMASSRQLIIKGENGNKPYGLNQEVAWNYGVNLTHDFKLGYRNGTFAIDVYRTDFENQVVADMDLSPQQVVFYNLEGKSFSNSLQVQVDYELIRKLDVRLAYRRFDVRTTYHGNLLQRPLTAANRAFINMAYETRKKWKFDFTVNWQGSKRIPSTAGNTEAYRLQERSPDFFIVNAQVNKTWKKRFEAYAGVENLLNFRQPNPILSAAQPFNQYFDASLVWGPVFGRNVYAGFRYILK